MSTSSAVATAAANDNREYSPGYRRLMDSLAKLNAALDGQAQAVAGFRESFRKLDASVQRCGASLERYQKSLDGIDVNGLSNQAQRLQRTAQAWVDQTER